MSVTPEEPVTEVIAAQAVIVADRDGVICEWNGVAEHIFGYSAVEAIGQTIDFIMPEEERADHWRNYRRVMATNVMNYSPDQRRRGTRRDSRGGTRWSNSES